MMGRLLSGKRLGKWIKSSVFSLLLVFSFVLTTCAFGEEKNYALKFDGKNSYIDCGNDGSLDITGPITIEAKVKPASAEGVLTIVQKGDPWWPESNYRGYMVDVYNGDKIRFSIGNGDYGAPFFEELVTAPGTIEMSRVNHVVCIFFRHYMRTYINGLEEGAKNTVTPTIKAPIGEKLHIGARKSVKYPTPEYFFNGTIYEVRIYNRALSEKEVVEHCKGIYKDESGLVLYIPFGDGAGGTATDRSEKGNHGTLYGYSEDEKVAGYGDSHDTGWTTISKEDRIIESKAPIVIESPEVIEKKLSESIEKRNELESLLDKAKSEGIDISYPQVSFALNKLFEKYIREDLKEKRYFKANHEVTYILSSTNKSISQITEWIADPSKQITVPYISINNLEIRDGEFYQGKEPVLLLGWVWVWPLEFPLSDFALQSSLGFNITECAFLGGTGYTTPEEEGKLSQEWFEKLDECMKEAEKNNIAMELIIEHVQLAPWVLEKYPSIFTCSGSSDLRFCLTNPDTKKFVGNPLMKAVPRVKDYPNLHSYCLVNEPRYKFSGYCSYCQKAFREYLKKEYHNINELNKSWEANYENFDEVGIPFEGRPSDSPYKVIITSKKEGERLPNQDIILKPNVVAPINNASMYDWQRFNQYRMTEYFTFMRDVIREEDKKTPIFWESALLTATWEEFGEDSGVDREEIGKRSDINGCDGWITVSPGFWPAPGGKYAMNVDTLNLDLVESLVPDKPIFNTEWHDVLLERGRNIIGYKKAIQRINPDYVRSSIWLAYLHGLSAGNLWCWAREHYSGYCALDLPQALESAGRTSLDLRRLAKDVTMFHRAPKEVAILFSMPSKLQNLGYIKEIKKFQSEGYTLEQAKAKVPSSHSSYHTRTLRKIHGGLYFLDTNYGFISEEQIKEGLLNKYKLLIIPRADFVCEETYTKIKTYLSKGGKVLLISDSLNYDERGDKRDITELFTDTKDISVAGFPVKLSRFGKGEIYQTKPLSPERDAYFFDNLFNIDDYRKLFDSLLSKTGIGRIFRITDTEGNFIDGVEFRTVKSKEGCLAYLINLNKDKVKIKLKREGKEINKVDELINNKSISFPLEIKPMDPLLIRIKK